MSASVDPATLSQEIDETRADVGETLDALQAKLSPRQLFDQAVSYCSDRGYELTRRIGDAAREHPIPMAIAGAGLLWYFSARRRRQDDEFYVDEAYVLDDDHDDDLYTEGGSTGTTERLKSAADSARRRAAGAAGALKDRAAGAASTIKERASGAASTLRQGAGRASGAMRQGARRAGNGFGQLSQEQPLLLGAVGFVIGAAIAAILPSSQAEDELLGEVSDRTFERAKQKSGEQYEKVRETVKRAAEGARRAVSESEGGGGDGSAFSGEGSQGRAGTYSQGPSSYTGSPS